VQDLIDLKLSEYRNAESFENFLFGRGGGGRPAKPRSTSTETFIFGAGKFGRNLVCAFKHAGLALTGIVDNDTSKHGETYDGIPVFPPEKLRDNLVGSHVVISLVANVDAAEKQLKELGLPASNIHFGRKSRSDKGKRLYYYLSNCAIGVLAWHDVTNLDYTVRRDIDLISNVYHSLADEKSKDVLISRIALSLSGETFGALSLFLEEHSSSVCENKLKFGLSFYSPMPLPEFGYYFNQDFLHLNDGEVYVDVGAEDGNTIIPFYEEMFKNSYVPGKVVAFEPDPDTFRILSNNVSGITNVTLENKGIGAQNSILNFRKTQDFGTHRVCGSFDPEGDIPIPVTTIDEYFKGKKISLIKFDPSGEAIIAGLHGASKTILSQRPKIIAGSYHKIENLYKIPELLLTLAPSYDIYLRHLAYHANETHAFAIPR